MNIYTGIVQRGKKRGSELGFPTANIRVAAPQVSGSYAARVTVGESVYQAAVYADTRAGLLEAHLLDFAGDLYGKEITIELADKIREDQPFTSDAALKVAIAGDVALVRAYFQKAG